jgi:hypothetical protein
MTALSQRCGEWNQSFYQRNSTDLVRNGKEYSFVRTISLATLFNKALTI